MLNKERGALVQLAKISKKRVAVSFSGGKDSLVALDLAYRVGIRKAVFCDTTIEFDETKKFVKRVERFYGIDIDVVQAPITFFEMIKHVGLPSRILRWCCDVFKFGPLSNYAIRENLYGFVTGLRTKESNKRFSYKMLDNNPLVPVKQINPILNWRDKDVWEYIKINSLPVNPLYKHFDRIGCWCCPFRTDNDWIKIKELFPEKASMFEQVLASFAKKMKVRDKEQFINRRGWTAWSNPVMKVSVGIYSPCQGGIDKVDLVFSGQSEKQIERIVKILPIITKDYFIVGNKLRITIKDLDRRRLNVLIEKAINCEACGACTSLCRVGALKVDEESIYVDFTKCTKCQRCIKTQPFRGACVIRNYSPKIASLVKA
jgi:phosphoadenosine phosphosulfate reductase